MAGRIGGLLKISLKIRRSCCSINNFAGSGLGKGQISLKIGSYRVASYLFSAGFRSLIIVSTPVKRTRVLENGKFVLPMNR